MNWTLSITPTCPDCKHLSNHCFPATGYSRRKSTSPYKSSSLPLPIGVPLTHQRKWDSSFNAIRADVAVGTSTLWASSKQIRHHLIEVSGEGVTRYRFLIRSPLMLLLSVKGFSSVWPKSPMRASKVISTTSASPSLSAWTKWQMGWPKDSSKLPGFLRYSSRIPGYTTTLRGRLLGLLGDTMGDPVCGHSGEKIAVCRRISLSHWLRIDGGVTISVARLWKSTLFLFENTQVGQRFSEQSLTAKGLVTK